MAGLRSGQERLAASVNAIQTIQEWQVRTLGAMEALQVAEQAREAAIASAKAGLAVLGKLAGSTVRLEQERRRR
jgi:hypothetical protein